MKQILFSVVVAIILYIPAFADDYIYDSPYGGKKVGKVDDDGVIYDNPYGGKMIGREEDGVVYDSPYGGSKVGRIAEDGRLYDKPYGGSAVGRHEDGKVYDKPYGGSAIGRMERTEGSGYWLLKKKNDKDRNRFWKEKYPVQQGLKRCTPR